MKHILCKIQIIPGKGSPYLIPLLITAVSKFPELGHHQIVASLSVPEGTHPVMNLFSSIQAQYHISHLFVAEFHDLIIEQHTIGGQRKTEIFIVNLLLLSSVFYQILYHLPVHQRLTAKEIHLQILTAA